MTLLHYLALEKLSSPLLNGGQASVRGLATAAFLLSLDPARLRETMGLPQEEFSAIVDEFCGRVSVSEVPDMAQLLARHLSGAFATVVSSSPEGSNEGDSPTGPFPDRPSPAGDSAGL